MNNTICQIQVIRGQEKCISRIRYKWQCRGKKKTIKDFAHIKLKIWLPHSPPSSSNLTISQTNTSSLVITSFWHHYQPMQPGPWISHRKSEFIRQCLPFHFLYQIIGQIFKGMIKVKNMREQFTIIYYTFCIKLEERILKIFPTSRNSKC